MKKSSMVNYVLIVQENDKQELKITYFLIEPETDKKTIFWKKKEYFI